jgi:hypothetical protein
MNVENKFMRIDNNMIYGLWSEIKNYFSCGLETRISKLKAIL